MTTMSETLGQKLWRLIEKPQGYAFISDSCTDWSDERVIERAKIALEWEQEAVKVLRRFIKEHDSPSPPAASPRRVAG